MSEYVVQSVLDDTSDVTLYRAQDRNGRSVLIKALKTAHPTPEQSASLRHDLETSKLIGGDVAAPVEMLGALDACPALLLADEGGAPLARRADIPMGLGGFFPLAISIADVVATLHGRHAMHLGLNPHHILVTPDQRVKLTSFGQAVITEAGLHPPRPARWPSIMWPYLSPEQTGQLGLLLDHRSDLYSLGVVYYQLLTGQLPLTADDLPGWIRCHADVVPPSPVTCAPALPLPVADIVSKLLAKLPDDRYQRADGLRHDLVRCRDAWSSRARIDPFALGQGDAPPPLRLSPGLYGRDDEISRLKDTVAQAGSDGAVEFVLISGPPGIGKTALVHRLRQAIPTGEARFAAGTLAAGGNDAPRGALLRALNELIAEALGEDEGSIAALRRRLLDALGVNAPLLFSALSGLARIIGHEGPPPEVAPHETERRFLLALGQLIGALAAPGRPLVVFLDDLQWADPGTLSVLEHWATAGDIRHVRIIGAWKDAELDTARPLRQLTARLIDQGVPLREMTLGALTAEAVTRWLADSLHRSPEDAAPLGGLLHDMTAGNPLFLTRIVSSLEREGLIHFSASDRAWRWDLARIQARGSPDDVADLLAATLESLDPATREAVRVLACHGSAAELPTLSILLGSGEREVASRLEGAFAGRLIAWIDRELRFLHDHIWQVAYDLTPPEERPEAHLAIARALLSRTAPAELPDRVFAIVRHLDAGAARITSPEERARGAELNLMAGRKALAAHDLASAIGYLRSGVALLKPDVWAFDHDLAFGLQLALSQCSFAAGELALAEELATALYAHDLTADEASLACALLDDLQITRGFSKTAEITRLKRSEEMLRHSLSLLETTLEAAADGILVVDTEGRMVRFNRRFVEMWGISENILASREDDRALSSVRGQLQDPGAFYSRIKAIYAEPSASSFDIFVFKDGRVLECYSHPQYLAGQVVGRVWSHRDITARVRAEQQRDQLLHDEMRAREAAEEAVRQREEFLSIASHELQTPLTSMQLAVQMMDHRLSRGMDHERARWAVAIVKRQVRRLSTLVDLLLDVSRSQAGRLELRRSEVDLCALARDVAEQLGDQLSRSGSTLSVQAGSPVVGFWDGDRLEQVVTNLLSNAIKFGEGKPIEVSVVMDGCTAWLSVTDHGMGIHQAIQAHLFDRFRRGVSARHYGGLGLGLYITRLIIEAHGGRVHAKSEVGRGSTFTVELPLTRAHQAETRL